MTRGGGAVRVSNGASSRARGLARAHVALLGALLAVSCHRGGGHPGHAGDAPAASSTENAARLARLQTYRLTVAPDAVDTTFDVRDHFIAGVEMQLSGEPLATFMGRELTAYRRDLVPANIYFDPSLPRPANLAGRVDLAGFSAAIESYEYSKQPLNDVGLESGAGLAGAFGPVTNPKGETGAAAVALLRSLVQRFGRESDGTSRFIHREATARNPLGWPGIWPTMMPFTSFDPHIRPTNSAAESCSISSDDDSGRRGRARSDDYECDYTGLHLTDRSKQTSGTVDPGSTGWFAWKAALWVQNYLQSMHDAQEGPISAVPPDQLARVGAPGNKVAGRDASAGPGSHAASGVFLGSSDIEGFQAAMFIQMMNDQVEEWLTKLATTDGAAWSGFADLKDALGYTTSSPLRWFPGSVSVVEAPDESGFPRPTRFAVASPDSHLLDLAGMLGGYASLYALTDHANAQTGGSQAARAYFDGDPFPDDDQLPDGEPTTHDRMLAILRVLIVNLERMHRDGSSGLLVDDVTMAGGTGVRGTTLSTDVAAYTLLALRTARRALDSELVLYGNTTPDTRGVPSVMDSLPPIEGRTVSQELDGLIDALARAFLHDLTDTSGKAFLGWNVATKQATDDGTALDAHTAAIRGLLVAYLATGDVQYRSRALQVYRRLESVFYFAPARVYQATASGEPTSVTFTPRRFGLLQGALRDVYELIGVTPGNEALGAQIEDRMARLNKLVLNGWDDTDQDEQVEWPEECVRYVTSPGAVESHQSPPKGGPAKTRVFGGLQMAERTLTGETGSLADVPLPGVPRIVTTDRDKDCVPEVSSVGLPAALANSVTFTLTPLYSKSVVDRSIALHGASVAKSTSGARRGPATGPSVPLATHSGPMAVSPDGLLLYVAHPDADAVTVIDTSSRHIVRTLSLAPTAPAPEPGPNGRYTPSIAPRALALDSTGHRLFVTGERSGHVYAFETSDLSKVADSFVCSEPIGVVVGPDGEHVFVACSQDDMVVELASSDLQRAGSAACPHKPWALAWASDGTTLLATHLLGWAPTPTTSPSSSPGVSAFKTSPLTFEATWTVADGPAKRARPSHPRGSRPAALLPDPSAPHGQVRGIYDAMTRPGTDELWVVHTMLGTDTPQPDLDFESTAFPAVTILDGSGAQRARLSVSTSPGDGGAFGDVVSGPRALTFSPDGLFAFVVDASSEDVLIIDARKRAEAALVRPLGGHLPEGAAWGAGGKLYVQERNTEDVAIVDVLEDDGGVSATVEGVVPSLARDPMPPALRLGQHLFYSANSDEYPLTTNHWIACATCHVEGRSDAVTWRFVEGPRDTPSNGGGMLDTGFLFRTADRTRVQDYWKTINLEQGGHFGPATSTQTPLLDALAAYVNEAIPVPVPPTLEASAVAAGEKVWDRAGCARCHAGEAKTDSATGNPSLDLAGRVVTRKAAGGVLLHDVGTCAVGPGVPWPDVAHGSLDGHARQACAFDTPALRGLWDSAPYFHDGSASTLEDVIARMRKGTGDAPLSANDTAALVTFLKSL